MMYVMKKKKILKKVLIGLGIFVVLDIIVSIVLAGVMAGIGPFAFFHERKIKSAAGNAEKYSVQNYEVNGVDGLKGKKVLFLGSSVTKGACSLDESVADYLEKADGIIIQKEAVSGTTLATTKKNSYVERLKKIDTDKMYDCIIVQLSTNDASQKVELGTISDSQNIEDFDTDTVCGAIEYIIRYCAIEFECPLVFYTGTKYDSQEYEEMVNMLLKIQEKWDIGVIDLWNDTDMNEVSEREYKLYMYDAIHPTRAGYGLWWTPKFETFLESYLQ